MDTEKYRTARKRIWATIVDAIVFMPFLLVDGYLLTRTTNEYILVAWNIFTVFVPIFYFIIAQYKYGQTIGKWVASVKVVDVSETRNLTLKQSILRIGVYLAAVLVGFLYYCFLALQTGDIGYLLNDFKELAGTPYFIWFLLEFITLLADRKRRAIHDRVARSVVIRTE